MSNVLRLVIADRPSGTMNAHMLVSMDVYAIIISQVRLPNISRTFIGLSSHHGAIELYQFARLSGPGCVNNRKQTCFEFWAVINARDLSMLLHASEAKLHTFKLGMSMTGLPAHRYSTGIWGLPSLNCLQNLERSNIQVMHSLLLQFLLAKPF